MTKKALLATERLRLRKPKFLMTVQPGFGKRVFQKSISGFLAILFH